MRTLWARLVRYRRVALTLGVGLAVTLAGSVAMAALLAPAVLREGFAVARHLLHPSPEHIRVGHGASTGSFAEISRALQQAVASDGRFVIDLVPTAGALENATRLAAGDLDVAFINSAIDGSAVSLVGLASVETQYIHVMVPVDSPARRLSDLTGTNWNVGREPGVADAIADYYRVDRKQHVFQTAPRLIEDFEAGRMGVAVRNQSLHAANVDEPLATGRFRLVGIEDAGALAAFIPGTFPATIPRGAYGPTRAIPEADLDTLGTRTILVARPSLPYEVAKAVTATLFQPSVLRNAKLMTLTEPEARTMAGLELHEAAADYYARNDAVTSTGFSVISLIFGLVAGAAPLVSVMRRRLASDLAHARGSAAGPASPPPTDDSDGNTAPPAP